MNSNMKSHSRFKFFFLLIFLVYVRTAFCALPAGNSDRSPLRFYQPSDTKIQYTGRIDFSNQMLPRFWAPGVYIKLAFEGNFFELIINDEQKWEGNNYVSIAIDDLPVKRIKLGKKRNVLQLGDGLSRQKHIITICKSTESGIGYLEFVGVRCKKLVQAPPLPRLKIEFIGNSITCGMGSDTIDVACNKGKWYDQNNAYKAYGPLTARALNAQWQLTSVSGIGLTRSCCGGKLIMPQVFDKINLAENTIPWNFKKFQPDIVTVCLGQNDGIVEADQFCSAYVNFLNTLRHHYPKATIICLTSPMADAELVEVQKAYLDRIVDEMNTGGDHKIHRYFFKKRYHNGCDSHPNLEEHQQIANELITFIRGNNYHQFNKS